MALTDMSSLKKGISASDFKKGSGLNHAQHKDALDSRNAMNVIIIPFDVILHILNTHGDIGENRMTIVHKPKHGVIAVISASRHFLENNKLMFAKPQLCIYISLGTIDQCH